MFDVDGIVKLAGGGVVGTYGLRLLWQWLSREKQDSSLYKNEVAAHIETRKQLDAERKLRLDAEMQLRDERAAHDRDREAWFEERDKDRELREQLKDEIFQLRTEVKRLRTDLDTHGVKLT